MNPTVTLVSAVALSAVVGGAVSLALAPASAPLSAPSGVAPGALAGLGDAVLALQREQERLAGAIDELRMDVAGATPGDQRLPRGEIEAVVAEVLAARAPEPAPGTPTGVPVEPPFDEQAALERLLAGDLDEGEAQRLWRQAADHGAADALLQAFEERVEADPTNPDARVDLGVACLQRIQEVGNGPLAGVYATRADQAFDAALAIDERHWDARFHKAVALSFWPPVFGKQGAAIQQFEVLVAQQAGSVQKPAFARTHLLLGNMYAQMGELEKAQAAWRHGAELFPAFEPLQEQLALNP